MKKCRKCRKPIKGANAMPAISHGRVYLRCRSCCNTYMRDYIGRPEVKRKRNLYRQARRAKGKSA